jgi:hypothetical protein
MQEERAPSLKPPEGLRPAQLGIVLLGRVILGHISATLADLAERGFLRLDEIPGDDGPDWLLTDLRDQASAGNALLRFEATLLRGLFGRQSPIRLSEITQELVPTLDQVRAQLVRDAVRNGRLRRWHRTKRTSRGEDLLKRIQAFRRDLRTVAASGNVEAMAPLAPYAMIFGFSVSSPASLGSPSAGPSRHRGEEMPEVPWARLDRFATYWQTLWAGFPADSYHGRSHPSGTERPSDFAHQWSAPREHAHGGNTHDYGHGGHGGGYGNFGGGHGGHSGFGGHGH